jgi:hypothetical protein
LLIERAVDRLNDVIERQLAAMDTDGTDVDIREPIAIRIALSEMEWKNPALFHGHASHQNEVKGIEELMERAQRGIDATPAEESSKTKPPDSAEKKSHTGPVNESSNPYPLLRLLLKWREEDVLGMNMHLLSLSVLMAWHRRLLQIVETQSISGKARRMDVDETLDATRIESVVRDLLAKVPRRTDEPASILRARILAIIEAVSNLGVAPGDRRMITVLDRLVPGPPLVHPADEDSLKGPSLLDDGGKERTHQITGSGDALNDVRMLGTQPIAIDSALPFLLLGPLSNIGFLDVVSAALDGADVSHLAPAFATTLAYKVLDPPERGWRHSFATQTAAAAFAGLAEPVSDSMLAELSDRSDLFVPAMNSFLARAVLDGRSPDGPLWLIGTESPSGWLLVDGDGVFPILHGSEPEEMTAALRGFDPPWLVIDPSAAHPALLSHLNSNHYQFLVGAPPIRGERLRALPKAFGTRWWTNDVVTQSEKLVRKGRRSREVFGAAREFWTDIQISRPAMPLAEDHSLDRMLTLAAGISLGQISWELWHQSERTNPLSALEYFQGFDAQVSFQGEHSLQVNVPLGGRAVALAEKGLLNEVVGVPWLGNRTVTFKKG